jgi:Na+:H+ antiporter, NhaC family
MAEAEPADHAPSLTDAIAPMVALAVLIAGSLALFGLDALDGPSSRSSARSSGAGAAAATA